MTKDGIQRWTNRARKRRARCLLRDCVVRSARRIQTKPTNVFACAHLATIEHPDAVTSALTRWLADTRIPRSLRSDRLVVAEV
jgi:hypothetical protein